MIYTDGNIVWGIYPKAKPITNLPADAKRVRIRMRADDFVRVYVKTPQGVAGYEVSNEDGAWRLNDYPFAQNLTYARP